MIITATLVKELREKTGVGMMDCKKALTESKGDFEKAIKFLREKGLATAQKKSDRATNEGRVFTFIEGNKAVILEINCETDFVASNDDLINFGNKLCNAVLSQDIADLAGLEKASIDNKPFEEFKADIVLKVGENITLKQVKLVLTSGTHYQYIHMNGKIGVLISFQGDPGKELGKDIAMHIAAANPKYLKRDEVPTGELDSEKEIIRNQALKQGKPEGVVDRIVEGKISKYYGEICLTEQAFVKDQDQTIKSILPDNVTIEQFVRYSLV